MAKGANKEINRIVAELRRQGWTVEKTKANHWKAESPHGKGTCFFSSTPGEGRSIQNTRAQLKRMGANKMDKS